MDVLVCKGNGAAMAWPCFPGESGLCGFGYRCKRHREEKSAARLPALVFSLLQG